MIKRKCDDCEYHLNGKCHLNPPQYVGAHIGPEHPEVYYDGFCSKWEPKWDNNPVISEAWELFLVTLKLAK